MSFLFLLFLVLITQRTSERWHFGIGWTGLIDTLHSLALPLPAAAGSLLRDPLMVNSVSDPESRISAFKEVLGFCSSEQPDNPSLFLLLFACARLDLGSSCSPSQRCGRPAWFSFSQQWALQAPHTSPSLGLCQTEGCFWFRNSPLCVWVSLSWSHLYCCSERQSSLKWKERGRRWENDICVWGQRFLSYLVWVTW